MKRVLFSVAGTVLGLVALLSFKTHGRPVAPGSLPSVAAVPAPQPTTSGAGAPPSRTGSRVSARHPASSTPAATTRRITGPAVQTQYGIVQVAVTATGTHIDSVKFVQLQAFDGTSQQINSYAAPILLQETVKAQSAHIDTVSGATYTSDGYLQSLQSALDAAGIK